MKEHGGVRVDGESMLRLNKLGRRGHIFSWKKNLPAKMRKIEFEKRIVQDEKFDSVAPCLYLQENDLR